MHFFLILCLLFFNSPFVFAVEASNSTAEDTGEALSSNVGQTGIQNETKEEIEAYTNKKALAISQAALGKSIGSYSLTTTDNTSVNLEDYRGKPLVISLIYTSCHYICPTTTQNLAKVVKKARAVLGEDSFNVLTIGFDTHQDTPEAMRDFAKIQSASASNWHFLSTDQVSILALSRDLGFIFSPSPHGFDHLMQASIIDKKGLVYRQVYGMQPQTPHFVEPLKELVFGEPTDSSLLASLSNKIRLFCTVYDPTLDRYKFDYSIFIGLFVGLTIGGVFLYLIMREWRYSSRTKLR